MLQCCYRLCKKVGKKFTLSFHELSKNIQSYYFTKKWLQGLKWTNKLSCHLTFKLNSWPVPNSELNILSGKKQLVNMGTTSKFMQRCLLRCMQNQCVIKCIKRIEHIKGVICKAARRHKSMSKEEKEKRNVDVLLFSVFVIFIVSLVILHFM